MALYENEVGLFSRRMLVLGGAQASLFALLVGRLQYLQVMQSDVYATLAEANRVNISEVSSARGRITDRNGKLFADNDRDLRVELVPEQAGNLDNILEDLQKILDLSAHDMRAIRRKIKRAPAFKSITIAEDLRWDKFSALNLHLPFLPGVTPRVGNKRIYPQQTSAAHLVGYVGAKTRRDVLRDGNIVGDIVGRSGMERDFEENLRGTPGVRHVEVNAYGRTVRELQSKAGQPGEDLQLSINLDLQKVLGERLDGHSGSAVVLDVHNGEVLAMASVPSFNPNEFVRGIDTQRWERLLVHERKPLTNKAMRGLYAPGSIFKMLVALAALEDDLAHPDETIACTGRFDFAGESFHCWEAEGHGETNMLQAIEQSCDVFFYNLALKVGIDRIEAMARRFGFGTATGINLSGEKTGIVPGRDWKRANYETGWRSGETVITGIGQGYLLTTPLQLAVMTAALANGGTLVTPTLTYQGDVIPEGRALNIAPEHLEFIQTALYRAVNRPDGTAYSSSLLVNGSRMAGKTGTVQVRRISKDERLGGVISNNDLDWHLRDHSLFVGYVPHRQPRYAISVVIEHGGGGAQVAAPIARDVMVHMLRMDASA